MRVLGWILLVVVVLAGAAGGALAWYTFSGRYSVAANDPHYEVVHDALARVYHASVQRQAEGMEAPEIGEDRVAAGALIYAEECATCHAAPGGERLGWAKGLMPESPHLPRDGAPFDLAEIYWLVENGVQMSGMPAWGQVLSEEEMWNVSALVARMPELTEAEYQQLIARASRAQAAAEAAAGGGSADAEGSGGGDAAATETASGNRDATGGGDETSGNAANEEASGPDN